MLSFGGVFAWKFLSYKQNTFSWKAVCTESQICELEYIFYEIQHVQLTQTDKLVVEAKAILPEKFAIRRHIFLMEQLWKIRRELSQSVRICRPKFGLYCYGLYKRIKEKHLVRLCHARFIILLVKVAWRWNDRFYSGHKWDVSVSRG